MSYKLRSAEQFFEGALSPDDGEGFFHEVSFDTMALPEIVDWQVGEEYLLVVKVREVEHKIEQEGAVGKESAEFKIIEVGAYNEGYDHEREMIRGKLR